MGATEVVTHHIAYPPATAPFYHKKTKAQGEDRPYPSSHSELVPGLGKAGLSTTQSPNSYFSSPKVYSYSSGPGWAGGAQKPGQSFWEPHARPNGERELWGTQACVVERQGCA